VSVTEYEYLVSTCNCKVEYTIADILIYYRQYTYTLLLHSFILFLTILWQ